MHEILSVHYPNEIFYRIEILTWILPFYYFIYCCWDFFFMINNIFWAFFIDRPQKCRQSNCNTFTVHIQFPLNLFLYVFLFDYEAEFLISSIHPMLFPTQCTLHTQTHYIRKYHSAWTTGRSERDFTGLLGLLVVVFYVCVSLNTYASLILSLLKKIITENPFDGLGSLHFFLGWLRTWAWNCYYFEGKIWFLLHSLEEKRTTKIEWRWIERSSIVLLLFRILIFLLEL